MRIKFLHRSTLLLLELILERGLREYPIDEMVESSSVWQPCNRVQHFVESLDIRLQSFTFLLFHVSQVCQWDSLFPSCLEMLEERGAQLLLARDRSSEDISEPLLSACC